MRVFSSTAREWIVSQRAAAATDTGTVIVIILSEHGFHIVFKLLLLINSLGIDLPVIVRLLLSSLSVLLLTLMLSLLLPLSLEVLLLHETRFRLVWIRNGYDAISKSTVIVLPEILRYIHWKINGAIN
jgi:hypothetical protein